jgi:hypothetical protein
MYIFVSFLFPPYLIQKIATQSNNLIHSIYNTLSNIYEHSMYKKVIDIKMTAQIREEEVELCRSSFCTVQKLR